MKVMVMVKASPSSEEGQMPSEELLTAMGKFNEELVNAGIMETGDGLKPSKEGYRVRFSGKDRTLIKGPFAETNELIAGYWIWNVASMKEAIEWVKKCPNPMEEESDIEIRSFFTMEDFAEIDTDGKEAEHQAEMKEKIALQKAETQTYLFMNGRCDEAIEFYQEHLGAKLETLFRFNDAPEPMPEGAIPPGFENKIMHCEFTIGSSRFMATDHAGIKNKGYSGFSLALTIDSEETLRKAFDALVKDGSVIMPLEPTFWSPLYGQVTDKFGIDWMLMSPGENP